MQELHQWLEDHNFRIVVRTSQIPHAPYNAQVKVPTGGTVGEYNGVSLESAVTEAVNQAKIKTDQIKAYNAQMELG